MLLASRVLPRCSLRLSAGYKLAYTKLAFTRGNWQQLLNMIIERALARYRAASCHIPPDQVKVWCTDQNDHMIELTSAEDLELAHMDSQGRLLKIHALHGCSCYAYKSDSKIVTDQPYGVKTECENCRAADPSRRLLEIGVIKATAAIPYGYKTQQFTLCHQCLPELTADCDETVL